MFFVVGCSFVIQKERSVIQFPIRDLKWIVAMIKLSFLFFRYYFVVLRYFFN